MPILLYLGNTQVSYSMVLTTTTIAIKHDCARSPQNRSCSPIPFFQTKTFSDLCSHAIPKTATISSGTYESYTASRIGIRTTLSRLTYAS